MDRLYTAADAGGAEAVAALLRGGADALKATSDGRNTALHAAARRGHADVAAVLLRAPCAHALRAARNSDGQTAEEVARKRGMTLEEAEGAADGGGGGAAGGKRRRVDAQT